MKPIQEYTKQEKLEAILEYNPCRVERNAVLRYLLAVRRDNAELIAYFESFGNSVHKIRFFFFHRDDGLSAFVLRQ